MTFHGDGSPADWPELGHLNNYTWPFIGWNYLGFNNKRNLLNFVNEKEKFQWYADSGKFEKEGFISLFIVLVFIYWNNLILHLGKELKFNAYVCFKFAIQFPIVLIKTSDKVFQLGRLRYTFICLNNLSFWHCQSKWAFEIMSAY